MADDYIMAETTNYIKHKQSTKNPINNFFVRRFNALLLREAKKIRPETVVDVGCGEGFTLANLKLHKVGKKIEGIEYMDEAIQIGKKLHPSITIKKGDIHKLPYADNSIDLVICSEVLEHLERPDLAMKELVRVTKKYLILSVPNEPWFTIQRFLRGKNFFRLGDHPEHIQHWSSRRFVKFVSQFIEVKKVKKPLPWTLVVCKKFS